MKLIHFTAEWCQPCKMMKPIIADILSERNDIEYVVIDIDQDSQTPQQYDVRGVPTFILERDGEPASMLVGARPKQKFIEELGL